MILRVIRFERRLLVADRAILLIAGLFILLVGYAIWSGFTGIARQQATAREMLKEHETLIAKARRSVEEDERQMKAKGEPLDPARQGPRHPISVLSRLSEFQVSLPPLSAAVLGAGQIDLYPTTYKYRLADDEFVPAQPTIGGQSLNGLLPERPVDNPLKLMMGKFDMAFVVLYIYPLIILSLVFNLVSGDKEAGTLAMSLAQPVRLGTLVMGKVGMRALLILTLGVLLPALAIHIGQRLLGLETSIARLSLWMLAVGGYNIFWFSLGLWVDARGKSTRSNALTLAVCWIALVVVIPALVNLAAQSWTPVPSGAVLADVERKARFEALTHISGAQRELARMISSRYRVLEGNSESLRRYQSAFYEETVEAPKDNPLLNDFLVRHPEIPRTLTANQLRRILARTRVEHIERRLAPLLEQMSRQRNKQQIFVTVCGVISPTLLLQSALTDLAGTSRARHEHFLGQVDRYVRDFDDFIYPKIYRNESVCAIDFDRLQRFEYREERLYEVVKRIALPFGVLITISVLLAWSGLRAYRRYPVIG